jgi:O-antigen/teichoic acid export membrane protein
MIAFLFSVLLLPIFSRMIKLRQGITDMVKLSFSILFTISSIVAVGSFFYSHEIMTLLYPIHTLESPADYALRIGQSAIIYSVLMFGLVAMATNYVFGTLLTANGNLKHLNMFAAAGVVISIVLNLTLVPRMQATGSAFASVSAHSVICIAQVALGVIIFKLKMNWRYILTIVFFTAGIFMMGYSSRLLGDHWVLNLAVMVTGSFLLSMILRLINLKHFVQIIRTE